MSRVAVAASGAKESERERERDNRGNDAEDAAYAAEVCVYHLSGGEKVESDES